MRTFPLFALALICALLVQIPSGSAAETELTITRALLSTPLGRADVKPGDSLTLATRLESDGDEALQDIELSAVFRESSGALLRDEQGDIINITSDISVLRKGESIDRSLRVRIPYTVGDAEQYAVELTARGYSANRTVITATHDRTSFTIDKLPHELLFQFLSISRDTAECGETLRISYAVRNIGNANEDVVLTIAQPQLKLSHETPFAISKDYDRNNTYGEEFTLRIPTVPSGGYPITALLRYREFTTEQELSLDVQCANAEQVAPAIPTVPLPAEPPLSETPVVPISPPLEEISDRPETPVPSADAQNSPIPYRTTIVAAAVFGGIVVLAIILLVLLRLRKIKRIMG